MFSPNLTKKIDSIVAGFARQRDALLAVSKLADEEESDILNEELRLKDRKVLVQGARTRALSVVIELNKLVGG